MQSKLKLNQFIGIIFTIVFGTFLHFSYEWSGNKPIVAIFSPINESVWEHLKLLFIPFLMFSLVEYCLLAEKYPNLMLSNTIGLIFGLISIIVLFYTYSGILGYHLVIVDILIFILSVILTFSLGYRFTIQGKFSSFLPETGFALLLFLFALFILFTFNPPIINLFKDPITDTYGALKRMASHSLYDMIIRV